MASKRSYEASEGNDGAQQPASKRNKNNKARDHQNAHIDPTWGQKYVFSSATGSTTVPVDPELDFEDDGDAMAYLKSVRTQANGIPHLLVAPKVPIGPQLPKELQYDDGDWEDAYEEEEGDRDIYTTGEGDFRGYYADGAYTARPDNWGKPHTTGHDDEVEEGEWPGNEGIYDDQDDESSDAGADSESAIREAYFAAILTRFKRLRKLLHATPPASAVAALHPGSPHDFRVGAFAPKSATYTTWSNRLRDADPLPAQLASMDKEGVLRVLRVLLGGGAFLRRGSEMKERTSRWLWALLARLPERGEMNHVEVGWVRDLGRRAVLMMQSLADMAALRDALEGEGMDLGVNDAVDESSDDEEALGEMEVAERDGEGSGETSGAETPGQRVGVQLREDVAIPKDSVSNGEVEDGEIDDDQKSEPMDVSEDGEIDEGEVVEEEPAPVETLEEARARLLAQVDTAAAVEDAPSEAPSEEPIVEEAVQDGEDDSEASDQLRARMNMRATLNMILTVAGEFYGQRDLLEFRDPFTGM
ncbi:V-SNARE protein [Colletotrichum scovillei]|uniref:V-SNARE protein n=1 Tax=Colletotrichum scovillei TaxID=1209932 RepID=A0A9P7UA99_9PEZI|nr:V-SNARE protein [Colletotrichum scovillei]KAG7056845.1 V-SNARE protein [Colletotrichum scovillei]KAG7066776.1 V-SNARE protein [Colletotrichum scovillei]